MEIIDTMQRVEFKYILSKEQLEHLKAALNEHMRVDKYGKTSIASIYYDTPSLLLIRTSIEKPAFKEKIRIRSYGLAKKDDKVFLEVKRKVNGLVYKRRIPLLEEEVEPFFLNQNNVSKNGQIANEINYFKNFYQSLRPAIMIIYDRTAYEEIKGDLRLTIDENPRYRLNDLNLHTSMDGISLFDKGSAILEIKVQEVMPLWLVSILSKEQIYKSSFSKVGEAYKRVMCDQERKEQLWAHYS